MEEIEGLKLQSQLLPDVDQKALNKLACEKSRKRSRSHRQCSREICKQIKLSNCEC